MARIHVVANDVTTKAMLIDMTTEHIHNWNDTCEVVYTCPLQRLQECVCGATRYVEIPDSGIPVIKLSDEDAKQYLQKKKIDAMNNSHQQLTTIAEKWKHIFPPNEPSDPMKPILVEGQQKKLI